MAPGRRNDRLWKHRVRIFSGALLRSEGFTFLLPPARRACGRPASSTGGSRRYPFGDGNESYANDEYATHRKDDASAHYYAWHRWYSATWGRFSSPDPYVMSDGLTNPQGWNRYRYVANDPVNYYDPRGLASDIPVFKVTAYCHGCLASAPDNAFGLGWALGFYMDLGIVTMESDMGWPGGGFGGAVPAPHEAATAIRDEVEAGRMTDCEGLAAFAKYAGQYYAGTTEDFVRSFGVFVPANSRSVKLVNVLTGGAIASSTNFLLCMPTGQSGFRTEYHDSLSPHQDQVHHFAAFFQFGYVAGALEGEIAAYLIDLFNPGDVRLGMKAAEMGYAVKKGFMRAGDVGKRIQEILCK